MRRFTRSLGHALRGIRYAFTGKNFRIQVVVALAVIAVSFYFCISTIEWLMVIVSIGLVLSLEATNSALEEICNKFHPETHPHIALVKDLAAGAVLIASITTFVVGLIIFLPYLTNTF